MKILFLTIWYPREDNKLSGIFVEELAKAISLRDEVRVINGFLDSKINGLYETTIDNSGIVVYHVKYRKLFVFSYLAYLFAMLQTFRKIRKEFEPQIIHAHVYKSSFIAIIIGRLYGIPVVVTEHAKIVDNYRLGLAQKIKNKFSVILARFSLKRADMLVLVSQSLKDHLDSLSITNKTEIIPNVVNQEIFKPLKRGEKKIKFHLLFVGSLIPVKGVDYLLRALAIVKGKRADFILDIIGSGTHQSEYIDLANDLGISENVIFHGRKDKNEVAGYMQNCDIFILPSLYETFGVVLIEAMACGKPVISTDTGGQKEFMTESNGILVASKDSMSLAEAILYMMEHLGDYDPESIVDYVSERFSYSAVGKRLHDTYESLII